MRKKQFRQVKPSGEQENLQETLTAMRGDTFRVILLLSLVATVGWYLWERIRVPANDAVDGGLFIVPVLLWLWIVYQLLDEQPRAAQLVYLLGGLVLLSGHIWLFQSSRALYLYGVLALIAVVIWEPWSGLAMAGLGILTAYLLLSFGGTRLGSPAQVTLMALNTLAVVVVGWTLAQNFALAVSWSLTSYAKARDSLAAVQARRAEVIHLNQELSRARERLERANAALVRAWRAAEEAERRQKQMTAYISHELRTPLNLIVGFSEMLVTSPETYGLEQLPPKVRRDLNAIYRSAEQVAALVDDVLDMASVDAGHLALMREPSDLWQVVLEAISMVRDYVETKNLALRVERQGEIPTLLLDRLRIRQVLLNLLINAARFTLEGAIIVRVMREPDQVRVQVHDTGKGIAPEDLDKIFQEFHASSEAPSWWGKGTGLGLPLSRRLVRLHGGEMGVESTLGRGSTFWFTLPLEMATDQGQVTMVYTQPRVARSEPQPSLVIYQEDEVAVHRLRRWLEGYHLVSAPSWEEARQRAEELRAVALLADARAPLPEEPAALPIIQCPLPSTRQWAQALGVEAYLAKPVRNAYLLQVLREVIPQGEKVLVVDDDERFVQLVSRVLETASPPYRVAVAYNGEEALQKMATERPDVVLLDLALPQVDGYQVLKIKAADPQMAPIPVIVISAPPVEEESAPLGETFIVRQKEGLYLDQISHLVQSVLTVLSPGDGSASPSDAGPREASPG